MALQTSGAISFSQIQAEFGGSNPISLSEYYRGGTHVPTTVGGAAGAWSAYYGNTSSYYWEVELNQVIRWGNVNVYTGVGTSDIFTVGGYDYQKGTLYASVAGGKYDPTTYYYRLRRRTTSTSVTVNTGIPSSGTVDMADFYGGRNT